MMSTTTTNQKEAVAMNTDHRDDPAIKVLEDQINEAKDELTRAEEKRDQFAAIAEETEARIERLRQALAAVTGIMTGEQTVARSGRKQKRRVRFESHVPVFRSWLLSQELTDRFGLSDVEDAIEGATRDRARQLLAAAEEDGYVELVQDATGPGVPKLWQRVPMKAPRQQQPGPVDGPAVERGPSGPVQPQGIQHPDKDIRKVLAPAILQGATLSMNGGSHYKLSMPGKQTITVSSTPGSKRYIKNLRGELRRHGYPLS